MQQREQLKETKTVFEIVYKIRTLYVNGIYPMYYSMYHVITRWYTLIYINAKCNPDVLALCASIDSRTSIYIYCQNNEVIAGPTAASQRASGVLFSCQVFTKRAGGRSHQRPAEKHSRLPLNLFLGRFRFSPTHKWILGERRCEWRLILTLLLLQLDVKAACCTYAF